MQNYRRRFTRISITGTGWNYSSQFVCWVRLRIPSRRRDRSWQLRADAVRLWQEELDVGLRMLETGMTLAYSSRLEVFHDCNRAAKHSLTKNNACQITNTALLPFLRYPLRYWPYALLQVANRVKFCLVTGRYAGIISGLLQIPYKCWQYRSHRSPVSKETIHRFLKLRRGGPIPIEPGADASVHDNSHPELQTTRS